MSRRKYDWGSDGKHFRHGVYEDYDHSDEEVYVYDQCCKNCKYFYSDWDGNRCMRILPENDEYPEKNESDWCEYWRGIRGRR